VSGALSTGLTLVTWNVLHPVHAVNWSEPAIEAWPDEAARVAGIAARVASLPADVVCLQEVSGDLLAALRAAASAQVLSFAYPRVPRLRRPGGRPAPADPTEHLAVVVRAGGARLVRAEAFPSDGGKGFLRVELASGHTVIGVHVSYGERHAEQCARLVAECAGAAGPLVLCGDWNADRATCAARLGAAFSPAVPRAPALPTRPRQQPSEKSQDIDHVFTRGARALEASVVSADGLSDHNLVVVRLES
jgi:endonuclease/exonuclease/phosphatase family metal-dependent hydrolase